MLQITVSAQTFMNKDSLLNLLPLAKKDTAAVHLFINLGQQYEGSNVDSAKLFYHRALALSKEIKYTFGEVKFISNYTYLLNMENKLDSSLLLNKQAIQLAKSINDPLHIGAAYGNTGASFQYLGKKDSAIVYYTEALKYMSQAKQEGYEGTTMSNISILYNDLGQYATSLKYVSDAEAIFRKINDKPNLALALTNKSNPLLNLQRFDEAEAVILEGIKISKEINNDYILSSLLLNMGDLKIKTRKHSEIQEYAEKALALSAKLNNSEGHVNALIGLAIYNLHKLNFQEAEKYVSDAYNESVASKSLAQQYKSAILFSDIALAQHKLSVFHDYRVIADSVDATINTEKSAKIVEDVLARYATEKKDNQIKVQQAELKRKQGWNYLLGISAASLALIGFLGYRSYSNKRKADRLRITELETEKQLTATEAVLKGEEQERTRLAKDLHDGLGGMLSGIKYNLNTMKGNLIMTPDNALAFERSVDMLDSSIQEMRRVAHNMMPEVLVKFGLNTALEEYCSDINKSGALKINYQSIGLSNTVVEQTTAITIYRIIQELINNAIKHANATAALVQVNKTDETLSVTVEDNGSGFDISTLKKARGIGWTNIQHRVDFLKGKIDVQSQKDNGTSVHIEINN